MDLYALDFGTALGRPTFIRMPSTNADGVGIVLPRRRSDDEVLEVTVMLRKDDLEAVELDEVWGDR